MLLSGQLHCLTSPRLIHLCTVHSYEATRATILTVFRKRKKKNLSITLDYIHCITRNVDILCALQILLHEPYICLSDRKISAFFNLCLFITQWPIFSADWLSCRVEGNAPMYSLHQLSQIYIWKKKWLLRIVLKFTWSNICMLLLF